MAKPRSPRRPTAATRSTLRIVKNEVTREAEVMIYGPIDAFWGVDAQQLVKDIKALDVDTIHVRINSEGGSVFDGVAIFNALREHKATVITHIDALAASIASVIALAGDEVRMADNAMFMIHDPWVFAIGNARDLRAMADLLDKINGASIVRTYLGKTGADESEVRAWMEAETWFTAEEAEEAGFVDAVDARSDAKAKVDPYVLAKFKHAPAALLQADDDPAQPPQTVRDFETQLRERLGFSRAAAEKIAAAGFAPQTGTSGEDESGAVLSPLADLAGDIRSLILTR